jgi:hypothetical protein
LARRTDDAGCGAAYACMLCPSLSDSLPTSIGDPPSPMRVRKSHRRAWVLRCRRAHVAGGVPVMGRMVRCGLATKRVHHAVGSSGFDARASSVWAKYFSILPLGLQENRVISIITRLHSFLLAPPGALSAVTNIRSVSTSGWPSVSLCNSDAWHNEQLDWAQFRGRGRNRHFNCETPHVSRASAWLASFKTREVSFVWFIKSSPLDPLQTTIYSLIRAESPYPSYSQGYRGAFVGQIEFILPVFHRTHY